MPLRNWIVAANLLSREQRQPHIIVKDLTMAFGSFVLMHDLNFTVRRGDIFTIMGGSGCGADMRPSAARLFC